LIGLALLPQYVWLFWLSRSGATAEGYAWLVGVSYLPLLAFLGLNRQHAWTKLIAVGVGLNVAVIVANGGAMPAPADIATAASAVAPVSTSYLAPGTKDRVVGDATPIVLAALADRIVIPLPGGRARLASVGDLLILAGGLVGLLAEIGVGFQVSGVGGQVSGVGSHPTPPT
jgi:hypothetical protein